MQFRHHFVNYVRGFVLAMTPVLAGAAGFDPIPGVSNVAALVGKKSERIILTVDDVKSLEPICVLILHYADEKGARWWSRLKPTGLLDRPEYQMARGTTSMHHYCWGQIHSYRSLRESDPIKRRQIAFTASREFEFVTGNTEYLPENWPYFQKMYTHIGDMKVRAGEQAAAINAYLQAIRLDKSYDLAYLGLAGLYQEMSDNKKAMEAVVEGLKQRPDSKPLRVRYDRLGGRKPYPEPYPRTKPQEDQGTPPAAAAPPAPAAPPPPAIPATPGESAASPDKKSFCRFCP